VNSKLFSALLLILISFSLLSWETYAQEKPDTTEEKKSKKIKFEAQTISFDSDRDSDAKLLKGNVVFVHEGVIMYCDSADFYSKSNSLKAYNNVHINQGDTLDMYGDTLFYNGNTRFASIWGEVLLETDSSYLETDSLNYDRPNKVAYYETGGKMVDSLNTLECKEGYYYTDVKDFKAHDSVVLHNPDYDLFSDTLVYNINSKIAYIHGPTDIVSDSNFLYCETGWYNTDTNIARFGKNAYLQNSKQILRGDSLYYERFRENGKGYGEAMGNVSIIDTSENVMLFGQYGYYYEEPERALVRDSAYCIHILDNDSVYLHADTLRSTYDTSGEYKIVRAYYRAKMYKSDFQGMSDSMVYSFKDSIVKLYYKPVLWSDDNQMTGDSIKIYTTNQKIDSAVMFGVAMIISKQDSLRFNQVKGFDIIGYFKDEELRKITMVGKGSTLYFATDDEGLVGANLADGQDMIILIDSGEVSTIKMYKQPNGTMNPINFLKPKEKKLNGFAWYDDERPRVWTDIFMWTRKSQFEEQIAIQEALTNEGDKIIEVSDESSEENKDTEEDNSE
jgi:lipopolysaccharide export system protein LptA